MKIKTALSISLVVIIFLVGFCGWLFLRMAFDSSAYYTENDRIQYEFYTTDLLKRMPRISKDYTFEYANISGPQAFVFTIQFNGTTQTKEIHQYLRSEGFELQDKCDVLAECWQSNRTIDEVTVFTSSTAAPVGSPEFVVVQVFRSSYKTLENRMPY